MKSSEVVKKIFFYSTTTSRLCWYRITTIKPPMSLPQSSALIWAYLGLLKPSSSSVKGRQILKLLHTSILEICSASRLSSVLLVEVRCRWYSCACDTLPAWLRNSIEITIPSTNAAAAAAAVGTIAIAAAVLKWTRNLHEIQVMKYYWRCTTICSRYACLFVSIASSAFVFKATACDIYLAIARKHALCLVYVMLVWGCALWKCKLYRRIA